MNEIPAMIFKKATSSCFSTGLGGFAGLDFGVGWFPQKAVVVMVLLMIFVFAFLFYKSEKEFDALFEEHETRNREINRKHSDAMDKLREQHARNMEQIEQRYLEAIKKNHETHWYTNFFNSKNRQ